MLGIQRDNPPAIESLVAESEHLFVTVEEAKNNNQTYYIWHRHTITSNRADLVARLIANGSDTALELFIRLLSVELAATAQTGRPYRTPRGLFRGPTFSPL